MAMNGHEVSWGSGWNHGLLKGLRVGGPGLGMCEKISVRAGWCWDKVGWSKCGKDLSVGTGLKTPRGKWSCEENLYSRLGWERVSEELSACRWGLKNSRRRSWKVFYLLGSSWGYDSSRGREGSSQYGVGGDDSVQSHGSRR